MKERQNNDLGTRWGKKKKVKGRETYGVKRKIKEESWC